MSQRKELKMASENEKVEDLVKELRGIKGGQHTNGGISFERWRARCQFADDYAGCFEVAHRREIAELCGERNGILNANASLAANNDRLRRKVDELRECLKEAIREKCPFLRMSCKHGEPCDYGCGTLKWRRALKGASND